MLTHFFQKNISLAADTEEDRQRFGIVMPCNGIVSQPQTTQRKPDDLMQEFFPIHMVINYRSSGQVINCDHGCEVMRKPHAVFPAAHAFNNVTSGFSGREAGLDFSETARKAVFIQKTREFAVFETTVHNHPM